MMQIPSAYTEGYAKARVHDPALADLYVEHTGIGDPVLDPVMEEIASLPNDKLTRFIRAGINQEEGDLNGAPQALREFFQRVDTETPPWLDHEAFRPAIRVFNLNVTNMLIAFVCGVLIEGFATLIAKSFFATGRVLNPNTGKRRLMQNNRQLLEVFYPGGLLRDGDGFRLSLRVRFVHARIRYLLAHSDNWDQSHLGTPISAAHLAFALTVFSMRLLQYSALVGTNFNEEEQASVMDVWRYTGYVMGLPEAVIYTTQEEARKIFDIAYMCEPPPDEDCAATANALIAAIPVTASIENPQEAESVKALAYRISRALIGNDLADALNFPSMNTTGTLFAWRTKQRFQRLIRSKQLLRSQNFTQLLEISEYEEGGPSYRLPDHAESSKSNPW